MKKLMIFAVTALLVACGGGDECVADAAAAQAATSAHPDKRHPETPPRCASI